MQSISNVLDRLKSADPLVREAAIRELATSTDPAAVSALKDIYQNDPDPDLRELAKQKLGERVSRGRKRGFTIPVQRWLVGRWQNALTQLLQTSILDREGWINSRATLDRLSAAAKEGWAPNQLWYIFVLESWLRHEQSSGIETVNEVFDHEGATVFG